MSHPNVLLVVLDSVRANNTSLHNYNRDTTPFLREFGDEATVYKQARAPGVHSIASHVSIFTGSHVYQHQVTDYTAQVNLTGKNIWENLSRRFNYETGLFTPNRVIGEASNLANLFEHTELANFSPSGKLPSKIFEDAYGVKDTKESLSISGNFEQAISHEQKVRSLLNCVWAGTLDVIDASLSQENNNTMHGNIFVNEFIEWSKKLEKPWAACLNLMDAHSPYIPDEDHNIWGDEEMLVKQGESSFTISDILTKDTFWSIAPSLEDLYDGAIKQVDSVVRNLINKLKDSGQFDNTLIVITSDHGEGFGEESKVSPSTKIGGHNYGIHEVLTHVPLVVKRPNQNQVKETHELATLTNFPELVMSCINNEDKEDKLIEDTVYSMTYRLPDSAPSQFPTVSDINQYIGPWKAVYTQTSSGINKYATRDDYGVTIHIDQSNTYTELEQDPHKNVTELYRKIEADEKFGYTTEEVSDELKHNLEDLGYI